jgi:hypothetical protein
VTSVLHARSLDTQLDCLALAWGSEIGFRAFPSQFRRGRVDVLDPATQDDGRLRQFPPQAPNGLTHVRRSTGIEIDQADDRAPVVLSRKTFVVESAAAPSTSAARPCAVES